MAYLFLLLLLLVVQILPLHIHHFGHPIYQEQYHLKSQHSTHRATSVEGVVLQVEQDMTELVRSHSPQNSDQRGKVRDRLKKTRIRKHLSQYHIVVSSMIISFCRSQLG